MGDAHCPPFTASAVDVLVAVDFEAIGTPSVLKLGFDYVGGCSGNKETV